MRKIFKYAAALSILVLAASCQLTDPTEVESPDVDIVPEKTVSTISVTASAANESTKTSISYDSENKQFNFHWKAGDKIQLLEFVYEYAPASDGKDEKGGKGETGEFAVYGTSDELAADTDNATFQVSMDEHAKPEGATYKYVGVYGGSYAGYQWKGSYPTVNVFLENWQTPTADSFDPNNDVLVSKLTELEDRPTELSLQFARLGGIIKLNLSGLTPGATITGGEFRNDEGFPTAYMIEYDPVLQKTVIDGEFKPTNSINFSYGTSLVADAEGKATVWLRCVAGTISEWFQTAVTLSDGKTTYSKFADVGAAKRTIKFEDGQITEIGVALEPTDVYAPEDVEATYVPGQGIRVTWSPVENASGYRCFEMTPSGIGYVLNRLSYIYNEKEGKYIATLPDPEPGVYTIKVVSLGSTGHGADNRYAQEIQVSVTRSDVAVTTGDAIVNGLSIQASATVTGENLDLTDSYCFFSYSNLLTTVDELKNGGNIVEATVNGLSWTATDFSDLTFNTTYYYVAGMRLDGIEYYGDVKTFTTSAAPTPDMVDLGLPSGTKWASFNVGATSESEAGYYYAWGETSPKYSYFGSGMYGYIFGWRNDLTKYCTTAAAGTVDSKIVLEAADDAATSMYGGNWRTPTTDDLNELLWNTTRTEDTVNGVKGIRFTSTADGYTNKSIFIPYTGFRTMSNYDRNPNGTNHVYLWSDQMTYLRNSLQTESYYFDFTAMYAEFTTDGGDIKQGGGSTTDYQSNIYKFTGLPVRAVSGGSGRTKPQLQCQMGELSNVTSTGATVNCTFANLPVKIGDKKAWHTAYMRISTDGENWSNSFTLNLENEHYNGEDTIIDAYSLSKTLYLNDLSPNTTYYYHCGFSYNDTRYFTSSPFYISVTRKFTTPAE